MITLDPYQGFTGHPEHQAVGRFAIDAARQAADPDSRCPTLAAEPPHRIRHLLHVQNKYWVIALVGDANDPRPYHDTLDAAQTCGADRQGETQSCIRMGMAAVYPHRSQFFDKTALISAEKFFGTSEHKRQMDDIRSRLRARDETTREFSCWNCGRALPRRAQECAHCGVSVV